MKSSACIVSVALLFLLSLGCSRRESRPSEPVASSSATVPPAASAADLQSHDDMLALTEQKAGLAHYPGAVISPTIPVAVRPDGSVQFALTTSDAMNQVVDHYVGELGLSFSGSLIAGEGSTILTVAIPSSINPHAG